MKNLKITIGSIAALLAVSACSPESANLVSEKPLAQPKYVENEDILVDRQKLEWITIDGGEGALDFNPRLDVLFVTDNSDSMKNTQAEVIRNLNQFTRGITKYEMIDYHIGVISVWDSSEAFKEKNKKSYGIGELRHIRDKNGKKYSKRFVSRKESHLLASTLNIGVMPLSKGGPEVEELFSPLAAALDNTGRGASNEDFFRQDSHLVVVLLTDADDRSSNISSDQMAQTLLDFKQQDQTKLSVYGVLVSKDDPDDKKDYVLRVHPKYNEQCFDFSGKKPVLNGKCTSFGPEKIESMIALANPSGSTSENILQITSKDFGKKLGEMGDKITAQTLRKEIQLPVLPLIKGDQISIEVQYGEQKIPRSATAGWSYNTQSNSIILDGNIDYQYQEGARFTVRLIPAPFK